MENGKFWNEGVTLVDGCTPCSPGCDHCWSAGISHRFKRDQINKYSVNPPQYTTIDGKFNGHIACHPERLARFDKKKPTTFAVWNDFFHGAVDHQFRCDAYKKMMLRERHTFLILTKRADFAAQYAQPFHNIYHGLTICTQAEADEKIPIFLQVPGKKFLCLEPLLEDIVIYPHKILQLEGIIIGCETGPHRRPMDLKWAVYVAEECDAAGVKVFVKALDINGRVEKDIAKFPAKLQRRELPWTD